MYNAGLKHGEIVRYYKMSRDTLKGIIRRSKQKNTTANLKKVRPKPKLLPQKSRSSPELVASS